MKNVRIAILGTGSMAEQHAKHFKAISGCKVVAGIDVEEARARAFCIKAGIGHAFGSLEAALQWGGFDAVANVTPDAVHHPTTMQLIAANKHVFCEKPLAENFPLADEMAREADTAGLVAMVNLTYRNVPAIQKARALVLAGAIGELRHVEASYRQSWLVSKAWGDWRTEDRWLWRLSEAHGSKGVLGDIGIHILDFVTYCIGVEPVSLQARLKTFPKAEGDRIGPYTLDANDSFVMTVEFPNGALGVIHASRFMTGYANTVRLHVFGDKGAIEIDHGSKATTMRICAGEDIHKEAWRDVPCESVPTNYEKFVAAIRAGHNDEPSFRRAAALQRLLDVCFDAGVI
jgi:predicted dehydrogenase